MGGAKGCWRGAETERLCKVKRSLNLICVLHSKIARERKMTPARPGI